MSPFGKQQEIGRASAGSRRTFAREGGSVAVLVHEEPDVRDHLQVVDGRLAGDAFRQMLEEKQRGPHPVKPFAGLGLRPE
jgi:hypothetical protein